MSVCEPVCFADSDVGMHTMFAAPTLVELEPNSSFNCALAGRVKPGVPLGCVAV